jgi:serine phosphatase RsbU (regulator of sigma subunit)/CHASE2 domain-containing sensor protein
VNALGGLRVMALLLLGALSLFIVFSPIAVLLRHAVFDGYQRLFPLERTTAPATIVLIDENSLARIGQWPWPRTRVGELVELISLHQPAAIGLDLIFPEPDRFSPGAMAAEHPVIPEEVQKLLEALPSNDQRFAASIRGRNVVLGISAETQPDPRYVGAPRAPPVVLASGALDHVRNYPGHIGNLPVIDDMAAGRGVMNSGPQDQVVRAVPLIVAIQGVPVPSLGVETLRAALGAGLRLAPARSGLLEMRFDEVRTRLQSDGHTWLRFSPHSREHAIPAAGLIAGDFNPELLKGKVVFVGVSGLGVQDYKTTPLGEFIPGVFVHAQVVENLYNGVWLARPDWALYAEAGALLLCGFLLIVFVPRLSALRGINLALAFVFVLLAIGIIAFLHLSLLFDPVWPSLGTLAVFGSVVVGTLSEAEKQRRQLRDQAAHMAGEVDAARRIQMGLLPDPGETLANDRRFSIAALLEPARTVGGDFYDCFMVDARRLFFVVADVSGKGLPAALFMAAVKSHIKSAALREADVGEALTRAQDEIARENPEQLFVTAFAGTLDVQTGELEYANAGHEPPFHRRPNGGPERLSAPGGPPLCVVDDYVYPSERIQLEPGEWVFIVTDGATEAMNRAREFFGMERLRASLTWMPAEAGPTELIRKLNEDVKRFAGGAEAPDDLTLMALRWQGGA